MICICGPSAAGKTLFTGLLASALQNAGIQAIVIGCDDYYREHWTPDPLFGFDTVEAIDADSLMDDLSALRSGLLKQRRRYDMGSRAVHWTPLDNEGDVVLLEGAYGPQLLLKRVPPDLLIYLEESLAVRALRRLRRDTRERERTMASVLRQMLKQMIPGERRFIKPLKEEADVVVTRTDRGLTEALVRIIDLCSSKRTH
ncbi:uridine kinase [Synechococcus sp. MEDNS5]|uniref:nucleoside kinase n=1 Tax=Synechococcus sp. MEDNS5 TaxID=1442554 RepID=UPI000B64154D|nr:nucleoside kinase [Synechococcus sp. MEDNS5]OUX72435.1 MAG: nucleoside kinase [Synechococcus sp. TMED90]QNJ06145.1 uridine kinase [Synechococcus sp. MEDNS5]